MVGIVEVNVLLCKFKILKWDRLPSDEGNEPRMFDSNRTKALTTHCCCFTPDALAQLIPCHGIEHGAHRSLGKEHTLAGLELKALQRHDDPPEDSNKSWRELNSA